MDKPEQKSEQEGVKMELTKEQQAIVNTTANHVVVVAAAASGKTRTLVARTQHLLEQGADPKKVVVITFTNNAADELADRLHYPQGLFIGTIHSYANYLLRTAGVDTSQLLDDEQFDQLFPLVKKNPQCIRPVDHLLLDESQDSTPDQFEFLLDMVNPTNYMLVGDSRQSIYRWNGADPQFILDLQRRRDVATYPLNENYRNGRSILKYAGSIIMQAGYDYRDTSIPMRDTDGKVITVEYSPVSIARTIKRKGDFKTWFVLCRTNDQVDQMMSFLEKEKVPCDSFKRSQFTNNELYQKMQEDTVKVLTIHAAKGLEADNVIVVGARFYNLEEKCISYVAATRARDLLVWTIMPTKAKRANQISSWET